MCYWLSKVKKKEFVIKSSLIFQSFFIFLIYSVKIRNMNPNDLPIANASGNPPTGIQKVSLNSFFPGLNSKKTNSVAPPAPISLPPMTESKSNLLEGLSETYSILLVFFIN